MSTVPLIINQMLGGLASLISLDKEPLSHI